MTSWVFPRNALLAGAIVLAVEGLLLLGGNSAVLHGTLIDPDCYMHLQRALRLMSDGNWHSTFDPRLNAPFGYTIHWTGLFDMLLVAGAAPLTWLGFDPHTALLLWGSAVSPLLLVAGLAVLAWGTRNAVPGALFAWATVLLFTQPQLAGAFLAGRPDHHSLVLALMLAQLAWVFALFEGRTGRRAAMLAGVFAGLQLVTSIEALLTILTVATGLGAAWAWFRRDVLKDLALYLLAGVATMVVWLLWENGRFLITAAYDRVSIAHVVALGSGTLMISGLAWLAARKPLSSRRRRFAALGLVGAISALITALTYPSFFLGPWPHLDPVIVAWHKEIGELQPLLPASLDRLAAFLAQMTAPLLALPLVLHRLRHGAEEGKPVMLLTLIGFVIFAGLALVQMRWVSEVQLLMLVPWTLTTAAIMKSNFALTLGAIRLPLRAFVLAAALLLQMLPAMWSEANFSVADVSVHKRSAQAWAKAVRALPASVEPGTIVMAQWRYGPEILWRSDLRVVAGPYEMLPALADTASFFDGSEAAAHRIIRKRRISSVLVCQGDGGNGFGAGLASGPAPNWLQPIPLQGGTNPCRLYRVRS